MMFPKALQAASRFRRSTYELRGHTSPVRADPRENLSSDVTSIKHTSLFISRYGYDYTSCTVLSRIWME